MAIAGAVIADANIHFPSSLSLSLSLLLSVSLIQG